MKEIIADELTGDVQEVKEVLIAGIQAAKEL